MHCYYLLILKNSGARALPSELQVFIDRHFIAIGLACSHDLAIARQLILVYLLYLHHADYTNSSDGEVYMLAQSDCIVHILQQLHP